MKTQNKSYLINAFTMLIGAGLQSMEHNVPGIIIISIGVIGILVTAIYSCWKRRRNKRSQISTSEHLSLDSIKKLKEKEDAANIDQFPMLNEESLKKHILLIIKNRDYPLNALIDKVSLYQGVDDVKYILVVKLGINEQHPNFLEFMNHWQPDSLRFLAHKNFGAEVYRSGYSSASCLLDDWLIWTQPLGEDLPDDEIIIKKYSWVLFRKKGADMYALSSKYTT